MWVKPGYSPPSVSPPEDRGERLATFSRGDGVELRAELAEFKGNPFISLRVWEAGRDGRFWPVKGKGLSVRLTEAGKLAEVLAGVANDSRSTAKASRKTGRRQSATSFNELPAVATPDDDAEPFDEFA